MNTFFDGIFMNENALLKEGIEYPIKIDYYKTITREENVENRYGIEIVKTEYLEENIKRIESKKMHNITSDIKKLEEILMLLRNNEVTPIAVQDVIEDLIVEI